ncbi:hypothetical protein UA08_08863 [Talaromyces atroroseus]|uniref:Rhodopsin domain-containing protein n=1 Tax=Talaromyces atroroseus TaxID=1441469 RepID=A0A225AK20_TALAT|nr:hypothetical protein UA08_08863 [Talaromyces atroroseus]OKL55869.1 hypothetical protein UA08_08863 [Talaromyces atroroseus]
MSGTDQPALASPSGVTPDFAHPRDALRTILFVTQCLCIPVVSVLIVLRLYVRFRFQQQLGFNELSKHGGGCYQWEIYESQLVNFMKIAYIATLFYAPMALFVKVALLTLLARIFKPYRKWVMFIYLILGVVLSYYIPAFVIKARICDPVSAYWNGTNSGGSCIDQSKVIMADSVISVVTDLAILILPLPLTWSLQMPFSQKLKVIGLLSAGGLATAFSLYRLVMIARDGQSPDQTMVFTRVVLTGNAEGGIGLICACLPALNNLISRTRRKNSYYSNQESHASSRLQLRKIRGSRSDNRPKINRTVEDGSAFGSDERTLISNADASHSVNDFSDHAQFDGAIMKSVAVSQSVEMRDT